MAIGTFFELSFFLNGLEICGRTFFAASLNLCIVQAHERVWLAHLQDGERQQRGRVLQVPLQNRPGTNQVKSPYIFSFLH